MTTASNFVKASLCIIVLLLLAVAAPNRTTYEFTKLGNFSSSNVENNEKKAQTQDSGVSTPTAARQVVGKGSAGKRVAGQGGEEGEESLQLT